ncbi:aspartate/glutamate racemase family protein [Streptomyces sp. Je 1-4]|uniref:aspartate/glutamate racemase family protein n=1 Tax=Streptomyces TaxID=1883 RepID=UPI0021DA77B6|nr:MULTISPECIES: aspartate/glutamate racemase family protein [unclassified Streptomyces]UYB38375.1 aspartate/glutamate racemase family protein [Streptomyces sp. Je 1-4]UZQ34329.1 aspartate/glutamate racemase family protein [Streptomyces sp. Je 1-4] [Streptomyces sp. Je 1-4 4N24]UZQ41747.1 aspartate/glutamate racemase family protein [Streptomyces sp. Je 1-4] [Streptomyces sp. Je 1-4 4N24_ara]
MLALLHTSPVHVPVFDTLRDAEAPGLAMRHLVRPELLDRARAQGPDAVSADLSAVLSEAVGHGARAVLCTCSTIGSVAEAAGAALGLRVLRVDRPMAAAAVAAGPRIAVLAALESTLAPTEDLIAQEARRAGREVRVRTVLVPDAWERFESGDTEGYLSAIAAAAREIRDADAIVLAQASMAPAAEGLDGGAPVLSSPRLGLRAAAQPAASDSSFSGLRTI